LTLPNNPRIRILAATVADEVALLRPAQPLYDTLDRSNVDMKRWDTGIVSNAQPQEEDDE
jgi:hypothetical protein